MKLFGLAAFLALTACAAAPVSAPAVLGRADIPVAPGHLAQQPCPFPTERDICVWVPGEVSRNDEEGEARLVADYVERFKASGWVLVHDGPVPVLAKPGRPPHCVKLDSLLWDDGRAARLRYQWILRVAFDPEDVACAPPVAP